MVKGAYGFRLVCLALIDKTLYLSDSNINLTAEFVSVSFCNENFSTFSLLSLISLALIISSGLFCLEKIALIDQYS